jgi:hypothetical protein
VIVSGDIPTPPSVWIRGRTPSGDELEVKIEVQFLSEMGTTIHQLAAHKALQEMEEGTGFFHRGKSTVDEEDPTSAFSKQIASEGTRIGTTFGVASEWTSFVAVERVKEMAGDRNFATTLDLAPHPVTSRQMDLTVEAGDSVKDDSPSGTMSKNIQYLAFHNSTVNFVDGDQHNIQNNVPFIRLRPPRGRAVGIGKLRFITARNSVASHISGEDEGMVNVIDHTWVETPVSSIPMCLETNDTNCRFLFHSRSTGTL